MKVDTPPPGEVLLAKIVGHLVEAFDYTLDDLQWFTVNAMKSAFIPFGERLSIIDDVIKPRFAVLVG